jgi:hypothetical protein
MEFQTAPKVILTIQQVSDSNTDAGGTFCPQPEKRDRLSRVELSCRSWLLQFCKRADRTLFCGFLKLPQRPQIIDPAEEHDGNQRREFCADINLSFGKNLKNYQCH